MSTPGSSSRGATLVLIATFALGMVAGAAILHIALRSVGRPPGPPPPPPVEHLVRELGLGPEQAEQLRAIVEESRDRVHDELDATRERIRGILNPEQRERFDAMRPPGPPPGPPPRERRGPPRPPRKD